MQLAPTQHPAALRGRDLSGNSRSFLESAEAASTCAGSDGQFVAMLDAYRPSGGLAHADEVVAHIGLRPGAGVAVLARWIVERHVISFVWQSQTWLPWFQFKRQQGMPSPELVCVIAELTAVYDTWELAQWFAQPNSALAGVAPVDVIGADADAVVQAARRDCFVANG